MNTDKGRLILVSNRLPVTLKKRKGELKATPSTGGLATGIRSFFETGNSIWIGWPGLVTRVRSEMETMENILREQNMEPVFLSKDELNRYYEGFCNETIWPLFHYFTQFTVYKDDFWKIYQQVNRKFADILLEQIHDRDIVWIHDYHLMLLPQMIRQKKPKTTIGFFLHIPFPSYEIFRAMPWRREILEGVLGSDLIGFHTYDYARHFLSSVHRVYQIDHVFNQLVVNNRLVRVDSFPMGIDFEKFAGGIRKRAVQNRIRKFQTKLSDQKVIISVDRLDYSKGILQRLKAYENLLRRYPQYRAKVALLMVVVPSRPKIPEYKISKEAIDRCVGSINGKYGTLSWTPIHYFYRGFDFSDLSAFYNLADIALVTPFRDGMNLVAKEFIASKTDHRGVLILSEMAGAASELSEAIIINPNHIDEITGALHTALQMPPEEQKSRNRVQRERLKKYDIHQWVSDFIARLEDVKRNQFDLTAEVISNRRLKSLVKTYRGAERRLLFLDYDGTLVHFSKDPKSVKPDSELRQIFERLTADKRNEIVVISGRDRETLNAWLGQYDMGMVAEHGAWIRERGQDWNTLIPMEQNWKTEIYPVLEFYVRRTPKSFIEEKDYSLVWHYRKVDSALGQTRSNELIQNLRYLLSNLNLQVLEGNKIVEVKNAGVDKGHAVLHWLAEQEKDFILAAGDDTTDEDIFRALPENAYSVKVGIGQTEARFRVKSAIEIRNLLKTLIKE